ncbi:MAG: hypothetical protein ACI8R4_002265 [Paracoccaceae bacterium]|jgi:hypothetical protein
MVADFLTRGWVRFAFDPLVADWAAQALRAGRLAVKDPAFAHWHVCQGTWFVGVDALDNDSKGRVAGSAPLSGTAIDFITRYIDPMPDLHRAQVSVVYPGYPQPRDGESPASFTYRAHRDAAHLDGVTPLGPDRRRMIEEPHAFILGLPLTKASDGAAPLVVWQGSHKIMRRALLDALSGHDPSNWDQVDLTEPYQQARRVVFDSCPRVKLPASPGQAVLLHRHTLHGVAAWGDGASAGPDGRMIAYFRPALPGGAAAWLAR